MTRFILAALLCVAGGLLVTATLAQDAPKKAKTMTITIACDNEYVLYVNGKKIGEGNDWQAAQVFKDIEVKAGEQNVIAVKAKNADGPGGLMAVVAVDGKTFGTSKDWKYSEAEAKEWADAKFDDKEWKAATALGKFGVDPWGGEVTEMPKDDANPAEWIWTAEPKEEQTVWFRYGFKVE